MGEYVPLLLYFALGPLLAGSAILLGNLLSSRSPDSERKRAAYECGIPPFGNARIQFKAGYYLFALLFLVFDIETVFLFPCVTVFRAATSGELHYTTGLVVFAELGIFIAILFSGLIYAWRKGALRWE